MPKQKTIIRDISWLSFNGRVLQEAADDTVPLKERIKFLGIFSNNLDEFFRVRVATLNRMIALGAKGKMHLEINPSLILEEIQEKVLEQQKEFDRIWNEILRELKKENYSVISIIGDGALTGGMAYEALNNAASLKSNFIIVLNDSFIELLAT